MQFFVKFMQAVPASHCNFITALIKSMKHWKREGSPKSVYPENKRKIHCRFGKHILQKLHRKKL